MSLVKKLVVSTLCSTLLACAPTFAYDKNDNYLNSYVVDKLVKNSVVIEAGFSNKSTGQFTGSVGTGLIMYDEDNRETYILTCNHVIPPDEHTPKKGYELDISAGGFDLQVVKRDPDNDLALLIANGNMENYFEGYVAEDPEIGDMAYFYGKEGPLIQQFKEGRINGFDGKWLFLNSDINHGNSGSPLFITKNGVPYLAGVVRAVYSRMRGVGNAVPGRTISDFLTGTPLENEYIE